MQIKTREFLALVTKIADLTEIPKIADIAIFRNAFAEVTEIMQIKTRELLAVVTKIAELTEITKITDIAIFRSAFAEVTEK